MVNKDLYINYGLVYRLHVYKSVLISDTSDATVFVFVRHAEKQKLLTLRVLISPPRPLMSQNCYNWTNAG